MAIFHTLTFVTFCLISSGAYISATHHSNLIKWVNITQVQVSDLEPAGRAFFNGSDRTYYVARTVYYNDSSLENSLKRMGIIPGKYSMEGNSPYLPYMFYGVDGVEYTSTDFELLTYPRGSVSWISGEKISSLDELVVGGIDPFSELLYLCRFTYVNDSVPLLMPGKLTTSGDCRVPYYGEITSTVSYEVLVVNAYGKYMDA